MYLRPDMSPFYFWMSCKEHIQAFSEIPNVWKFHHDNSLCLVFKVANINLVMKLYILMEIYDSIL